MSASTATKPPVRAAFAGLIDYAGLFPPAKLALSAAVSEYAALRAGPYAWMLGRFIVPASLLIEDRSAVTAAAAPLSVIVDANADSRQWFGSAQTMLEALAAMRADGVPIESLEAALPRLTSRRETFDATIAQYSGLIARAGLSDLPAFVEVPRGPTHTIAMYAHVAAAAARARVGMKLRCGGLAEEAFPSVEEVAQFVADATAARVPFKATAGLHHPVRRYDPASGFVMHGFLNVLAAAALAPAAGEATLRAIVAEEDPGAFRFSESAFAWRDRSVDAAELARVRREGFVAYGSCSFDEPASDLVELGVLSKP